MKTISKIAAIALVAAFVVVGASSAKAATVAELQALIAQLTQQIAALSGTTAPAASVTFTSNLTVGSKGAEVSALQDFLAKKGFLTATARGYFGALTKSALAAYQTSKGISPTAGYFGPATRAAVNAEVAVVAPVATTTTTTTTTLSGVGTLSVDNYTSDVEDTIDTGSSQKVLGFRAEASDGDVNLTNVKISANYTGAQSNRLNRYFSTFKVIADGKTVATVDAADFNRDSAGQYSKTVSLSDAVVKKGSSNKVTFYVVASAIDSIDSLDAETNWTISADNFRYVDGTGAILTESPSDAVTNSGVNVRKLSTSSDVKVKFSTGEANPDQQTVLVDQDTSGTLVTLLEFKLKAEGTDMSFDTAKFNVTTTGSTSNDMISEFRLVKGSSVVQSTSTIPTGSSIAVKFDLDNEETIAKDDTTTYKLVAKLNKNTDGKFNGSTITAVASTTLFNVNDKNGDVIALDRISGSATGNTQTVRGKGVSLAKTSISESKISTGGNTPKDYGEFIFTVKVTADGDDVYFADSASSSVFKQTLNGGAATAINAASTTVAISSTSGATKTSGVWRVNDGDTATITYKVTQIPANTTVGTWKMLIDSFNFNTTGSTSVFGQAAAFTPADTFTSGSVTLVLSNL